MTQEFSAGEPEVDIMGDVAVVVCPYSVVYELEGNTYREKGCDLLVFSRSAGEWSVVWRTMQTESAEKGAGEQLARDVVEAERFTNPLSEPVIPAEGPCEQYDL